MENNDAEKGTTGCYCKIDRQKSSNVAHECRWKIRKSTARRKRPHVASWEHTQAIEVFPSPNDVEVEHSNEFLTRTSALTALLLKGFRRYQTKSLTKKNRTPQRLKNNVGVER